MKIKSRDKEISYILFLIDAIWKKYPNLRFGQIYSLIQNKIGSEQETFYIEDDILIKHLENVLNE